MTSCGTGHGPVAGSCDYGSEPSRFVKDHKFLDNLRDCQLLNKDSAIWGFEVKVGQSDVWPA